MLFHALSGLGAASLAFGWGCAMAVVLSDKGPYWWPNKAGMASLLLAMMFGALAALAKGFGV